ncbi:hypothetical protein [Marinilactibacillus psychrotolerans]|uniref:Uncharacterized protein n=1 Tax=Marinilactibacillus psychrotolerans TaxID=191770 RepID=A0A5R9C126_9LACT|nr:hypothetical protein [Marinilactibacillus psychrotolerans]TLQ06361.1 hypothetical protein FEZ48_10030 [Marinilactibacillus psychrotolerans]
MTNTILSWRKFTAQQEEKIKALAPDYKLISSLEEADNLEDIEVVYGWNSEEGNKLSMIQQIRSNGYRWLLLE